MNLEKIITYFINSKLFNTYFRVFYLKRKQNKNGYE